MTVTIDFAKFQFDGLAPRVVIYALHIFLPLACTNIIRRLVTLVTDIRCASCNNSYELTALICFRLVC